MTPRKGFITIDEAVDLINSDTRSEAKVDTKYLVWHTDWIEPAHNFRIPLMRTITDKNGNKKVVRIGSANVEIRDGYDAERLKHTIRNHYRDLVGHDFESEEVRAISSVADDEVAGGVKPRKTKPFAKKGQAIGTGETITTNGASL